MTQQRRIARPFTGKHMAAIMIAFFGVVIAVNVLMARLATSTFGGLVVENSYVASQKFNRWLGEARSEKALGWKATVTRGAVFTQSANNLVCRNRETRSPWTFDEDSVLYSDRHDADGSWPS